MMKKVRNVWTKPKPIALKQLFLYRGQPAMPLHSRQQEKQGQVPEQKRKLPIAVLKHSSSFIPRVTQQ